MTIRPEDPSHTAPAPANPTRNGGRLMLTVAWVIALAGLTWLFQVREARQYNPNQHLATTTSGPREVVLTSNHQHHYVAPGFINNQPVIFMLDTGASDVVIPQPLARRLGLKARGSSLAQTANGVITVHGTLLDSLQLGPITLHNVRASINPAMRDQEILLGMSALRQLEFSQRDGQLTIRQHGP